MRNRKIVLGTDFSGPANAAARWISECFAPGAELVLVHVVDVPRAPDFFPELLPPHEDLVERARARAEPILSELGTALGGTRVETEVRVGRTPDELSAAATAHSADLLVIGPYGERRSVWPAPGSTVERLLQESSVPVLVAQALRDQAPRRILVPVDDSPFTRPVLRWAGGLGEAFDARVVALHVLTQVLRAHLRITSSAEKVAQIESRARASAEEWLRERLRSAGLPSERTAVEIALGNPASEILAALERNGGDLVVMGTRGAGMVGRALVGSVARSVVRGANCPVLLVVRGEHADE